MPEDVTVSISESESKALNAYFDARMKALGLEEVEEFLILNFMVHSGLKNKNKIEIEKPDKPHMIFQIISGFISALTTQDPSKVHYDIIRATLKKIKPDKIHENPLDNTALIDLMARNLAAQCKELQLKLNTYEPIQRFIKSSNPFGPNADFYKYYGRKPLMLTILELDIPSNSESVFELDGMFFWDKIFLDVLKNTGKAGKNFAESHKETYRKRLVLFKSEDKNPLIHWFNLKTPTPEEPFHVSPALQILSNCIYEDFVAPRIKFAEKYVPAITKNISEPIKKILSPRSEVIDNPEHIQLLYQDAIICNVNIPTISQKMSHIVLCGANKLNTVTGHRVLRHFPQEAFKKRISGIDDYRVLRYDRGSTEIAEILGVKSNNSITAINQVIHAMAYLEFSGQYFSGNLIQLTKYKSPITKRQEAFEIVVGTPLLPYQTFKDGSLLIPLLSDPPLVNPNQSHAGQYLLQMELMEECSNQSIFIVKNDVIEITQKQWETLAQSSGLSIEILKRIQDRWTQDGTDGEKLLEKVSPNFYKLGPKYSKEWEFLKEQGSIRIKNSNLGKTSALKRINPKYKPQSNKNTK